MNLKKILAETGKTLLGAGILLGACSGVFFAINSCLPKSSEQEVAKRRLYEDYRRDFIWASNRLEYYADENRDGKLTDEEYNSALRRGGYEGPNLKKNQVPSKSLRIFQRAIQSYQEERYKKIDN